MAPGRFLTSLLIIVVFSAGGFTLMQWLQSAPAATSSATAAAATPVVVCAVGEVKNCAPAVVTFLPVMPMLIEEIPVGGNCRPICVGWQPEKTSDMVTSLNQCSIENDLLVWLDAGA